MIAKIGIAALFEALLAALLVYALGAWLFKIPTGVAHASMIAGAVVLALSLARGWWALRRRRN